MAGFFSSTTLAVNAKGIAKFIENGGNIKLVCSPRFTKEDVETIKQSTASFETVLEKRLSSEITDLEDACINDHIKVLAWLLANKRLEIKIAVVLDEDNIPLTGNEIHRNGIFHQKVGILEDIEGNKISFSGSDNESAFGWINNIEEFKVFREWVSEEIEYLISDVTKFNKFWNHNAKRTKVVTLPEAVERKIIKIAPNNIEEINLEKWYGNFRKKKKIELFNHQKKAVNNWLENGMKGLFEMATGTGKTFTALGCLEKVLEKEEKLITVIACPYGHLIKQWNDNIDTFGIMSDIIIADSTNPKWKIQLPDYLLDIKNGISSRLIILTTHDSFSSNDFIKRIRKASTKLFLVVDEVHGIGAPIRKNGLISEYQMRLGLSATPKRWLDPEGTEYIFDYFGNVVEEFSLKKAINSINPSTGETYLTPYEYKPYFVELTEDELIEYEEQSAKIARAYYKAKSKQEKDEYFSILCIQRQDIIKNAANKLIAFKNILDEISEINLCLVYCSPNQIGNVQDILNRKGIVQHKFTMKENTKPEDKYGGISERDFLLKKFAEGKYQALVAIKCLDEGVDVPPAKIAIILASSGNPRQYIQRRGRILRNYPGKEKAIIYDIIVTPSDLSTMDKYLLEFERRILEKELKRYKEFTYLAFNKMECLNKIESLEKKYKIVVTIDGW